MPEYKILVPPPKRHRTALIVTLVVVVVAAAVAVAFVAGRHTDTNAGHSTPGGGGGTSGTVAVRPLTVVSTVPATGATDVPSDQAVTVQLSSKVTASSGMPTFSPPVSGTWVVTGPSTLAFRAAAPFVPTTTETLLVPSGSSGVRGSNGALLAAPVSVTFTVTQATTERLQQLLGQLNYLPLSFAPAAPVASPKEEFAAQGGTFAWRWPNPPPTLSSLWSEGSENVITKSAVMNFENQNGLAVDGVAGKQVWSLLQADVAANKDNVNPYDYVLVSKQLPENLTLFENGTPVMSDVAVNTGAPGADTVDGTYPVFEHVPSSRMVGTNPDGSTYNDPAVPWASFFLNGDALHGFVRATYGSPQSNGCVEMPIATAATVYPLTPIGTLVTVVGPPS
jgi:peptidoglycan hydrolase-like protein with peptidoglycan-binding domain